MATVQWLSHGHAGIDGAMHACMHVVYILLSDCLPGGILLFVSGLDLRWCAQVAKGVIRPKGVIFPWQF